MQNNKSNAYQGSNTACQPLDRGPMTDNVYTWLWDGACTYLIILEWTLFLKQLVWDPSIELKDDSKYRIMQLIISTKYFYFVQTEASYPSIKDV